MQNKDWDTGGEIWGKNEIDRVENYSKKYGIECHGVPLTVKWFLDLLEAAVKHEREVFAETLKNRLGDAIHPDDFESMRNLIDDVSKESATDGCEDAEKP